MSDSLVFKPYKPGDEHLISGLFQNCYSRPGSLEYWSWRFLKNPRGSLMIELCWDKDILVSQYAVSPMKIIISGEEYFAALAITVMTHPDYRGQGLPTLIANQMFDRLAIQGYKAVWGFPNNNSHFMHIEHLKWHDIHEIPMFHLELRNLSAVPKTSPNVKEILKLNQQFDDLFNAVKNNHKVIVKRDQVYLNWRFVENPINQYHILGYTVNDMLLGYLVYKKYLTGIDIVDLLTVQDDHVGLSLVAAAIDICFQENLTGINMWLPLRDSLHMRLEKLGFSNTEPITHFAGRLLQPQDDYLGFDDVRNWHYTMSDSDVF